MRKTRRTAGNVVSESEGQRKPTVTQRQKVRPLTSVGPERSAVAAATADKERSSTATRRPKTAQAFHQQKQTTNIKAQKYLSSEKQSERKKLENVNIRAKVNRKRPTSHIANRLNTEQDGSALYIAKPSLHLAYRFNAERDRSTSFGSDSSRTSKCRGSKSKDLKANFGQISTSSKSSIRLVANTDCPTSYNPVQRKVAWQSDADLEPSELSESEAEEIVKDSFQPPLRTQKDSGSEYDTDLETDPPAAPKRFDSSGKSAYLKHCKQEDVLPVSTLQPKFEMTEMAIRHRGLGTKGTLPLAKSLLKNVYVEKLDLSDNCIEGGGASFIASMLSENCYITQLDLSENSIGADGGIVLAEMLTRNQILRKLVLRSNRLTDRVAKRFAVSLRENRTLWHLDLSHNEIGEQGAVFLGAGLALNYGLKNIDLSWNCIRGKGGVAIAQALKTNDTLSTINLSWNGVSLLGCVALGKFLRRNENLKELDVRNNRIGYLGAQRISPGVSKNTSLETLKLGLNPLGDDGVAALLKAVKANKSLKIFSLENVTVSSNAFCEIEQLEKNRPIKIITGGLGSFKKPKEMPQQMAVLLNFIKVNRLRLVDWFFRFDKDHSGDITKDEFKTGLQETGLKMTQKQLDTLIEYLDVDNNGKIEFSELLIGREHTLREQRDLRIAQQNLRKLEDIRTRLPTIQGFEPD